MEDVFTDFKIIQGDIESIVDITKVEEQFEEQSKFEDSYYDVVADAKKYVAQKYQ